MFGRNPSCRKSKFLIAKATVFVSKKRPNYSTPARSSTSAASTRRRRSTTIARSFISSKAPGNSASAAQSMKCIPGMSLSIMRASRMKSVQSALNRLRSFTAALATCISTAYHRDSCCLPPSTRSSRARNTPTRWRATCQKCSRNATPKCSDTKRSAITCSCR